MWDDSELSRQHGVAENTNYRWKSEFGGMEVSKAKRVREFEQEKSRLKQLRAEAELDKAELKEIVQGNGGRVATGPGT